ncbi:MAG: alpha/beta fold hydrolase [Candidatus Lokiarchaeota archaeon]|nr:alpha/beta fold hydrolase [Candidatus Lokiarchaeota archaeon]
MIDPWFIFSIILIIASAAITYYFIHRLYTQRWKKIHFPDKIERIKVKINIPRRNSSLEGEIYRLKEVDYIENPAPTIIICHGYHSSHERMDWVAVPLALQGYSVLAYDHFGHGVNRARSNHPRMIAEIIKDFTDILNFVESRDDLDNYRIAVIGFSMGGLVALTTGYTDPRVRVIIANCAPHDLSQVYTSFSFYNKFIFRVFYHLTKNNYDDAEYVQEISPKYYVYKHRYAGKRIFLTHCKDDSTVRIDQFNKNKALLKLKDEDTMVFNTGGHSYYNTETLLMSQVLKWLKQNF